MAKTLEVIVGTYEEFLLGYKLESKNTEQSVLVQSFADKSHAGSLKCVATSQQFVVTGGSDDRIFVYDMKNRKQSQILLLHEGTINTLAFTPDGTHLLSGSEDGKMVATRVISWHSEACWKKAHGGLSVTQISCHPSGKLALSLGNDCTLKTWNLVKGRVAYQTNLRSKLTLAKYPDCLSWSPNGEHFTLTGPQHAEIWGIKNADVIISIKCDSKPNCAVWVNDCYVLFGLDNGRILFLSVDNDEESKTVDAHSSRIKSLAFVNGVLATASSTGDISLWTVNIEQMSLTLVATTNIGCRPTCIALLDLKQFGSNYDVQPIKNVEKKIIDKSEIPTRKFQSRGIVTIEYEGQDDPPEEMNEKFLKTKNSSKRKIVSEINKSNKPLNVGKKTKIEEKKQKKKPKNQAKK